MRPIIGSMMAGSRRLHVFPPSVFVSSVSSSSSLSSTSSRPPFPFSSLSSAFVAAAGDSAAMLLLPRHTAVLCSSRRTLFTSTRLCRNSGSTNMRSGTQKKVQRMAPRQLRVTKRKSWPLFELIFFFGGMFSIWYWTAGRLQDQQMSTERRSAPIQKAIEEGKFASVEKNSGWY